MVRNSTFNGLHTHINRRIPLTIDGHTVPLIVQGAELNTLIPQRMAFRRQNGLAMYQKPNHFLRASKSISFSFVNASIHKY